MSTETPTQSDVDASLRNIESLVEQIGDQVVDDLRAEADDGTVVRGRQVQHGQYNYQALAAQSWPYVQIQSQFNAVQALAIDRATSANSGNGQPVQLSTDEIAQVHKDIRDTVDEDLGTIRQGLIDRISEPGYGTNLDAEGAFVTGFTVSTKLFPYEEEPSAKEFYEAVQGVISLMYRGKTHLVTQYGLQNLGDDQNQGGPRGFQ